MNNQHPFVSHPVSLRHREDLRRYERGIGGKIGEKIARGNDIIATHLGLAFGSVWVVWAFFIWPLIAHFMGSRVEGETSYYAQSWIQLFALPLFVYIGNKLQRSSDAQSEVIHQALTHIATVSDQNKQLLEQNTELTEQVHLLTEQVHSLVSQAHETSSAR